MSPPPRLLIAKYHNISSALITSLKKNCASEISENLRRALSAGYDTVRIVPLHVRTMPNIGMGDSHFDFLFVNDALSSDEDHFSNLQLVESKYRWRSSVEGYNRMLRQADSKIDWRYRIARWMLRIADDFLMKRDTGMYSRTLALQKPLSLRNISPYISLSKSTDCTELF